MIDTLASAGEMDLLAISQIMGGLVFKERPERDWFRRRFSMFQDILRESWVYQEIGQEYLEQGIEKGIEQGIEKGIEQGKLEGQREMLLSFVQRHFPEVMVLAKQQIESITDSEVLQAMFLKLSDAESVEEVKKILFEIDNSKNKH